jgi:hypothetical protein
MAFYVYWVTDPEFSSPAGPHPALRADLSRKERGEEGARHGIKSEEMKKIFGCYLWLNINLRKQTVYVL